MSQCPPRDRLERLLDHGLVDTELAEIEQHVEDCADCQRTLDELTDATHWDLEPAAGVVITLTGSEPGFAVDPLGITAGPTGAVRELCARGSPSVPGYEIKSELGRGGMGVIYKARHVRLNRPCALKMILAGAHASPEDVARFLTEAEAIARLQHAHIVQIRQIGEADGLPFLELEYLSAGSLDQKLDGTPWPAARAARLAEQVAMGIAEAHRQGIVHRDLKPSNVLLAADGTPKVGDFGLAKMLGSESGLTRTESVMGSPSYMAPEQAQGRSREAGAPVDVYSMGAILYELLTGRPPFRGTTALETLEQVKTTEPVPPSRLVPGLPRDIDTICLKCLQKEPVKRYEGAQALAGDLRRFLEGRPIRARRVSGAERAWRWCRRNRFVAGMSAIAVGVIIILAAGATMAAFTFRAQRDQIRQADRRTRENLFDSLTAQARATRFSRQVGQRFESLAALDRAAAIARELKLPPKQLDRVRDEAIACLALPDVKTTGRVIDYPAETLLFCFDLSMNRYALRLRSGMILVRRVDDDQEIARFQARGNRDVFVFAFSPDGRYLTTTHVPGFALTVWDLDRNTIAVAESGPLAGTAARFSPDSRRIALAHYDGEVLIYDLETGRPRRFRSGQGGVQDLAFRPDGLQIAVTNRDTKQPKCRILEMESGRVVRTIPLHSGLASVAWSQDGTTLATTGGDFNIDLWDAASGMPRARLEGSTNGGLHATFLPAGKLLASNGWEGRLRLWDAVLGHQVLSLTGTSIPGSAFSRDGQIALAQEDRLTTYQVDPGLEYRTLLHVSREPLSYQLPSIHPDNRLLAIGTKKGVVFWDLVRATECAFLPIGIAPQVLFEATGDLLTNGTTGVWRWPVKLDPDHGEFRIGPPRQVPFSRGPGQIAADALGQITARTKSTHAELQVSGHLTQVGPLDDCRSIAVSPDGEWLATGSHHVGAQVWRVGDTVKVAELPVNIGTSVSFSPDGNWLMTQSPPCRLWATNTWTVSRELGGHGLCFSPDSRLVAIMDTSKVIRLAEAESGRVIARLESPDMSDVGFAAFTPDGSRLLLTIHNSPAIHVWDLRAIRRGLVALGLDWDAPAYSEHDPADPAVASLPPLEVDLGPLTGEIEHFTEPAEALRAKYTARIQEFSNDAQAYHHRGHALRQLGCLAEAIDDFTAALRLRPNDAHVRESLALACNNRAWELATGPGSSRDPEGALTLARRAVELAPNEAIYLNTLGVAEYRSFLYAQAIATLERSLAAGRGETDAFDLLFLAMAHHRQGHGEQARARFDRAVRWLAEQKGLSDQDVKELAVFRAEAERVLTGLAGELPVDAFAPSR